MPLGNLQNLNKFKPIGGGKYQACCPAHDDKGPSLAIRELDDGRLLLHCFAGCSTQAVLEACGMTFQDLMPDPVSHHAASVKQPFSASQGLRSLSLEAGVLMDCARQVHAGARLGKADRERLKAAYEKIGLVSEMCR